ncbi:molecular chaperone DnaJ [Texas Phoenix palm phytoplasma]|uniref:Chaperone protein DnaJ n=1 Tax=Texas Phoenix palm phytoplasma TaxID=176709 RepID=A0ABS5BI62_9MOLU|nr:molecular chaperone DnaJ [Texas Phoenix palm phytoplasma]MBP3059275.1 molecular chaperone DnaJ [Texas Phoenix palm phytoplasma]
MKKTKDYYEILGLTRNATEEDIKKAYKKLSKKYHPDVSKDPKSEEKFKEVQEAYHVLKDPNKRSSYDRFGNSNGNNFHQSGFQGFGGENMEFDFGDIFESFFGSRQNKSNKNNSNPAPEDKHIELCIDFMDSVLGAKKEINFVVEEDCHKCHGTGAQSPKDIELCSYCDGTGYITVNKRIFLGNITTQQICPQCKGKGQTILNKCYFCQGKKRVKKNKRTIFNIPAGVEKGMTFKLEQQGDGGHLNSPNGDLYIEISIKDHEIFKREKQNIISTAYITFYEAVLGTVISVPTIYGEIDLKIPEGTQSHTSFRIKNKGVPYLNSSYKKGDHYVIIKITTPKNLTTTQKNILKQFKELEKSNNNKKSKSWFFK